jgi:hypothetical protein
MQISSQSFLFSQPRTDHDSPFHVLHFQDVADWKIPLLTSSFAEIAGYADRSPCWRVQGDSG